VASNCLAVVNDLSLPCAGRYGMVFSEIKSLESCFLESSFRHDNRASNSEAHRLARSACSANVGCQVWFLKHLMVFVFRTMSLLNKVPYFPFKKMYSLRAQVHVLLASRS
jgi:hypothetical protein